MAWLPAPGVSNDSLVDSLIANKLVTRGSKVERALRAVDRAHFCAATPYVDAPQALPANATISAPHMHAKALSLLTHVLEPGATVLDVGCGSGYVAAALAVLVARPSEARAQVIGVEHVAELVASATASISRALPRETAACVSVLEGDGRLGAPAYAPFNAIHVGAAAAALPRALIDQLAPGGRMVCPVGAPGGAQILTVVDKLPDGSVEVAKALAVRYVPLCDVQQQLGAP